MKNRSSITGWMAVLLILPIVTYGQITWLSGEVIELGIIPRKSVAHTRFILRNDEAFPLRIENIRTSCGCTVPHWESIPVMPGDTLEIPVEWRPNRRGSATQRLDVYFFGVRKPVKLRITGEVR